MQPPSTIPGLIRLVLPVMALLLFLGAPCGAAEHPLASGHVPAAVKQLQLQPLREVPPAQRLNLSLGLPLCHREELDALLRELYAPSSPVYRRFLTPEEFTERFAPTAADYEALAAFARSNHFTITATHPNRLLLNVSAAAGDVEKSFHIQLKTYRHPKENREFFAPDAEPTVDARVPLLDISGLDNYRRPKPNLRPGAVTAKGSGSGAGGTFMGNDFRAAYLPGMALTGAGQAVALVEFDGFYTNDITSYKNQAGLPDVPLQVVLIDGYNGMPDSANSEVSLDITMAISMAPGLDKVIVYEAAPDGTPNHVLNRIATDNQAKQISCSWGWGGGPDATTDEILQQMAAQGQSFFCASGDSDAFPAGALDDPSEPNSPAGSPYLTSVGGTTLTTTGPGGTWLTETVWNSGGGIGSSGGSSGYYTIPSWQQGVSMTLNGGSTTYRNVPDVALTADNVLVFHDNGSSGAFRGTSCAAPLWAGFTALVNQQAATLGAPPVGFLNPALYAIAKEPGYGSFFHDIQTGNNVSSASPNDFHAVSGFDLCTGWGTPVGAALIEALASPPDVLQITPANGFTSTGLAGGPFDVTSQNFTLTNSSADALAWSLGNTSLWLHASTSSGTIPASTAATVVISLDASALALPPGAYSTWVSFTNNDSGKVQWRKFNLQAGEQLVQNSGFETGNFSSWTQSGNTDFTSVTTMPPYVHSGGYGAQFGPYGTPGFLSTTLPTVAGQRYLLNFFLIHPGTGTPNAFSVSWNGATLYSGTNLSAFGWTNMQFLVEAATASTLLQFAFRNDPTYFGLDDVSVVPVAAPMLQVTANASHTATLSWNSRTGLTYQVQYKTNLSQPDWLNLGVPLATTNPVTLLQDTNAMEPQRFYRVRMSP